MNLEETCKEVSALEITSLEDLLKLYTALEDSESCAKINLLIQKRDSDE
jgi:hypothetical protein